jgi:hypothetical protein
MAVSTGAVGEGTTASVAAEVAAVGEQLAIRRARTANIRYSRNFIRIISRSLLNLFWL